MIIMKYHELGDLTHYVTNNFFKMSWSDKLQILDYIITGLKNIHHANIIHKDYHSGNIFMSASKIFAESRAVTGNLGISKYEIEKIKVIKYYGWIEVTMSPDIGPITTKNPGAIYKSRPLSEMIKSAESTRNLGSQSITLNKLSKYFIL